MIKGCLFDIDGVVADSHKAHYESMVKMFNAEGFDKYTEELDYELTALSTEQKIRVVAKQFNVDFKNIKRMLANKFSFLKMEDIKVVDMQRIISYLESKEIAYGFVTNARQKYAEQIVEKATNRPVSSIIIFSNESGLPIKPAPNMYIAAMTMLKIKPRETIIFEDSIVGINAAIASRTHYVKVDSPKSLTLTFIKNEISAFNNTTK